MQERAIRFVTANYAQLQGLRLVPLGLFLLLWTSLDALGVLDPRGVTPSARAQMLTRFGLVFWMALGLALAAPLYYRYRYGTVDGHDRTTRNRWITLAVIGFFVFRGLDNSLDWPVSLSLMLVSVSLFVTAASDDWVRPYYSVLATMWLIAACAPLLGMAPPDPKITTMGLGGLSLVVIGIGDHRLLTHTLTPST